MKNTTIRGRGTSSNPLNRFERIAVEADPELDPQEVGRPETLFLRDGSRSVISYNSSPDVGFNASLNPYRGCEHGCSYCYARPTHEFLGISAGLDFETRISSSSGHEARFLIPPAVMGHVQEAIQGSWVLPS